MMRIPPRHPIGARPAARTRRRPAGPVAEALEDRRLLSGLISIGDASSGEGDPGSTPVLIFTIRITASGGLPSIVMARTSDGTASAAEGDYTPTTRTFVFDPASNVTQMQFRVPVIPDTRDETDETVNVSVTAENGSAVVIDGSGVGTIVEDDDHPPTVASFGPVAPSPRDTPVDSVNFSFSEGVDHVDLSDLTLTRDGGPNLLSAGQSVSGPDFTNFVLAGLSDLTRTGGTYTLTLSSNAAATGIADGEGNPLVGGASITWVNTSVVVPPPPEAGPYGPEFRVNTYTPSDQKDPAAAMDGGGSFVVVWTSHGQDAPNTDGVYAQRYDALGAAVGPEFRVNVTAAGIQNEPAVAMNSRGDWVVAWKADEGTGATPNFGVFARRFGPDGQPLTGEIHVNAQQDRTQSRPAVAIDPKGNFVVAWDGDQAEQGAVDTSFGVYARRFSAAGAPRGDEFQVNQYVRGNQYYPTVASDHAGEFVVAWQSDHQDPGDSAGVYAQWFGADGVGHGEVRVNADTDGGQGSPAAAMADDGRFVVAFADGSKDVGGGIMAQLYDPPTGADPSLKPTAVASRISVNVQTLGIQDSPAVVMDGAGDFVVTWHAGHYVPPAGPLGIWARRFARDGTAATGEFQVNTTSLNEGQVLPTVAMDDGGDFVVAWESHGQDPGDTATQSGVYAQLFRFDRPAPQVVQVYARGTAWAPAFLAYLDDQGLGSDEFGFAIDGGGTQLRELPWLNVDELSVRFDRDVVVRSDQLTLRGVNVQQYSVADFNYEASTHTATWKLAQNLAVDKLLIVLDGERGSGVVSAGGSPRLLDGEWTTGKSFPSGNGAAGGSFRFRFDVLPGDVDHSGDVLASDYSGVKKKFFANTTTPGTGDAAYSVFYDVDGSGIILANDFSEVKKRFFNRLPDGQPTA
jgi:hypothetical protein